MRLGQARSGGDYQGKTRRTDYRYSDPLSQKRYASQTQLQDSPSWLDCFSGQNGLTTTRITMAINANVGSSLTIRKNRAECTLLFVLKASRHRASVM